MEILEKSVWFNIVYRTWQGEVTMSREEVKKYSKPELLPPEDLIKPGSKAITDIAKLTKIKSFGRKVKRECEKVCLRAFGNYGTSLEESKALVTRLEQLQAEHSVMVKNYLDEYEITTEQWIIDHPEWEEWLRHSKLSRKDIENRFVFEFQVFQIQGAGDNTPPHLANNLNRQVNGLLGTLLDEIEEMAQTTLDKTYANQDKVSQKALSPIRGILKKLDTLKFIHNNVFRLVVRTQDVLNAMPKTGAIEGSDLSAVYGLLSLLSSRDSMLDFMNTATNNSNSLLGFGSVLNNATEDDDAMQVEESETEAIDSDDDIVQTAPLEPVIIDSEVETDIVEETIEDDTVDEAMTVVPETTITKPSLRISF
jgi:hypothetical protein